MKKLKGRHELKHYINYADMLQIRSRLPHVASLDKNAIEGNGYRVRSLYFDNYSDKALREKNDGVDNREKFRLRYYNENTGYIGLEKKSKRNGICFKEKAKITKQQCECLLNGDIEILKQIDNPLCMELYTKILYQQLRPKNIVEYWREPYVYPAGNVRVTLDYDIRTDLNPHNFLSPESISIPITNAYILEVKYDNYLPEIIRGMVSLSNRRSTSFSKYAIARII
ncbi:MAG: polyphosphate polymerase domain-containing protein [Clostridiales bacterium]|nr:polyphosphate polymerase domain-containing protein [Clostridiales bacterium]